MSVNKTISGNLLVLGSLVTSGASPALTGEKTTALNTVGAGTILAAALLGGVVLRGGAQSGSAFTDTTDTAALIAAALPSGTPFPVALEVLYQNNTNGIATIAGGAGITVSANTVVPGNSWARFLLTMTSATAGTMVGISAGSVTALPASQYSTAALQSAQMTAAQVAGAAWVNFDNTGTTPANLQMPTAANLIAAIPNAQIGMNYMLAIRNSSGSANTATITTATGITLTGTMTIAQTVTRLFNVSMTGAATVTVQSMGILAAGA